jgi:SAM-dependent methyltransferase
VDPALFSLLICPRCKGTEFEIDNAACAACGLDLHRKRGGYVDLIDVATIGEPTPTNTEQRFMESDLVAHAYDRVWRPTFVRLLAGKGAGGSVGGIAGEMFIHKHSLGLDDREGPWLDLSCGPGGFTRALGAAAPGAMVVGLDISRAMLDVAAKRCAAYPNVALVRADAHTLPFRDHSFGGVNNAGALHAYDDPEQVFREVLRILRPGGIFVGSTFAEAPSIFGRIVARAAGIRRFSPSELRSWLQRIGFSDYEDVRMGSALVFRTRRP